LTKIVLVTGGFDPLHSGHINIFTAAKRLGDVLIVGVNSDEWLARKKGRAFMPLMERANIIRNLRMVDYVIDFSDSDNHAKEAIKKVRETYPGYHIVFANGGDRTAANIPEMDIDDDNVSFEFGIGGHNKMNSSSWILEEWKSPKVPRKWGYYKVLHEDGPESKVKELTVMPGQCLSMQRHTERSEFWFVTHGVATLYNINKKTDVELRGHYNKHTSIWIPKNEWHQLCNETTEPLRIVEIQYGTACEEKDIERK
jgi:cytidyltransferase-like protein